MKTSHPLLGIDLARDELMIAIPPATRAPSRRLSFTAPTLTIDTTVPGWWRHLLDLIDETTIIAAESTGHHLLAPIGALLAAYRPGAKIFQIEGKLTQTYRRAKVHPTAKTDRMDAIALLLIAQDIAQSDIPHGAKDYDPMFAEHIHRLRMLNNALRRAVKDETRTTNRLSILAHNLCPDFDAHLDQWLVCARFGLLTPADIRIAINDGTVDRMDIHKRTKTTIKQHFADLPAIDADSAVITQATEHLFELARLQERQAALWGEIQPIIDSPPMAEITRRWRTIPGNSDLHIVSYLIATFEGLPTMSEAQFTSSLGANPTTITTGDGDYTKAMRKGYKPARGALHMHAFTLLNPKNAPNPVYDYIQRKYPGEMKAKHKMANARTKLARLLFHVANDPAGYQYQGIRRS